MLTKFSLAIDDQNVCHIGSTIRSAGRSEEPDGVGKRRFVNRSSNRGASRVETDQRRVAGARLRLAPASIAARFRSPPRPPAGCRSENIRAGQSYPLTGVYPPVSGLQRRPMIGVPLVGPIPHERAQESLVDAGGRCSQHRKSGSHGLSAGGRWIRTSGSAPAATPLSDRGVKPRLMGRSGVSAARIQRSSAREMSRPTLSALAGVRARQVKKQ